MSVALIVAAALAGGTPADDTPVDRIAPVVIRVVPAAPTAQQLRAQRDRTELVCRSTLATGSLVIRNKACLTRKQWAYVDDYHEVEARRLVATSTGGVGQ